MRLPLVRRVMNEPPLTLIHHEPTHRGGCVRAGVMSLAIPRVPPDATCQRKRNLTSVDTTKPNQGHQLVTGHPAELLA